MIEKRGYIVLGLAIIGFLAILIRSFFLQVVQNLDYNFEVQNLSTRITVIPAKRGNIYDRNGKLLAWSEKTYQLINKEDELDKETEKKLRVILKKTNYDSNDIIDKLNFQKKLSLNITSTIAKKIATLEEIEVKERNIRKYSHISLFHILGYVDGEGNAKNGLESSYDEILKGHDGAEIVILSPTGKVKRMIEKIDPIQGKDIYLSLDIDLQKRAYDLVAATNNPGSVIFSDPSDGSILVFVSYPSVDSNLFSSGISNLEYRKILNNSKQPLLNRAISGTFAPGSVFKPFIAYNVLTVGQKPEERIFSDGRYELKNSKGIVVSSYNDWNLSGHGWVNFVKSLRVSANTYYYWMGERYGIDFMYNKIKEFKFDEKTGIDIPGEREGFFPNEAWKKKKLKEIWYPGETLMAYIGQGYVNSTPIEILRFYNILATKGKYYKFHSVYKSADFYNTEPPEYIKPQLIDDYKMNESYLALIKQGMEDVTTAPGGSSDGGTAFAAFKGFKGTGIVAGKTGTAEIEGGKRPHSWMGGYYPANNPRYSFIVFVQNGGFGSHVAAPIARELLDMIVEKDKSGNKKK